MILDDLDVIDWSAGDVKPGQRAIKLGWISWLLGRKIASTKDLSRGEAFLIRIWLVGGDLVERPRGNWPYEEIQAERLEEVERWVLEHEDEIRAEILGRPGREAAVKAVATKKGLEVSYGQATFV